MASPLDVVLVPVKAGLGVAQSAVEVGVGAARAAFGAIAGGEHAEAGPLSDVENGPPRSHEPAAAPVATAPPAAPPATVIPEEQHVDTEPVLVAAIAEEGAEDGAGAELHVEEPWEGYSSMRTQEIQRELEGAGREALAAVELYEHLHQARSPVLESAARRLAQLS